MLLCGASMGSAAGSFAPSLLCAIVPTCVPTCRCLLVQALRQASSGMCLGVLPLVPAAACQNRVAPMDCATGGPATRWTMQPHVAADIESGTSTYVLVSQLNKQPLNVYGGPLDPGRRDREVQTCSPVNTQANNPGQHPELTSRVNTSG